MLSSRIPTKDVLTRLTPILLSAGAALPFTLLVERNPIDLAGPIALVAYFTAASGGTTLLPVIVVGMAIFLLSRAGISWRQRAATLAAIVIVLSIFLGGGAYLTSLSHFSGRIVPVAGASFLAW